MARTQTTWRFEVRGRGAGDPRAAGLPEDARALGLGRVTRARNARLYFVRGTMTPEELELLGRFLFSDHVVEDFVYRISDTKRDPSPGAEGVVVVEVMARPGVTDAEAQEALRAAREMGLTSVEAVATGRRWELEGSGLDAGAADRLASALLANSLVERWSIGPIDPTFVEDEKPSSVGNVERIDIATMDDEELMELSRERRAALDLDEMGAIRDHFAREGRAATDIEFEMIAQTWSEHCVHKTFKARIEVGEKEGSDYPPVVDSIFSTYIRRPTEEIAAPWVLSAFVDNAGIIEFDEGSELSFKVETHNHPSAVEPFGGANTGLGGVIRDIMGVSARPIASTDVLCFGPSAMDPGRLPKGSLHPRVVTRGVVAGIEDYGNKMGIPTVNGGLHYHEGYASNPLVYCGCVGFAPRGMRRTQVRSGDRVIAIGGLTGRDGIRGATFSSMAMDAATGEVAGASVQIGDPIAQKKALDVLLAARDRGLYDAVTDCGAGGFSSAVGEMAAETGVEVELSAIGTKYAGLAPWELWLSEAQERMVLAVPPEHVAEIRALCELYGAGFFDLGSFGKDGRIVVRMRGEVVLDLPAGFLHEGLPRKTLRAAPGTRPSPRMAPGATPEFGEILGSLLSRPGASSAEEVVRRYDHEVQGGTILAPFDGPDGDAPQDASVIMPQGGSGDRAFAVANGFRASYAIYDPYRAAISAHDECLRNLVAVGADPARIAVLDNFCMGDPGRPEVMWDLLESARACRDAALEHRTPFISGKDSFFNEYEGADGQRTAVPPSLLISGIGIVPEPERVPGSWLKAGGNILYLVGDFAPVFGGSLFAALYGVPPRGGAGVPEAPPRARLVYSALHRVIMDGFVESAHDVSEGGLACALAEMCMGGRLGAALDLSSLVDASPETLLFGETNGCLVVEVNPVHAEAFERIMAGLPLARLGGVEKEPMLAIKIGSDLGIKEPIRRLLSAWKGVAEVKS